MARTIVKQFDFTFVKKIVKSNVKMSQRIPEGIVKHIDDVTIGSSEVHCETIPGIRIK